MPFIPIPLPEKVLQTSSSTILLYKFALQTGLGIGMGINGTAQLRYLSGRSRTPSGSTIAPAIRDSNEHTNE